MCILLLSNRHPRYPLVVLSNRDEFLDRPTERAHDWSTSVVSSPSVSPTHAKIIAGRDLEKGGTWLAINADNGRFAGLTNVREPPSMQTNSYSRGYLVSSFVSATDQPTEEFFKDLRDQAGGGIDKIGGFSMIFGTLERPSEGSDDHKLKELSICSNRDNQGKPSEIGIENPQWALGEQDTIGISNGKLGDGEWNKVTLGRKLLHEALEKSSADDNELALIESLFEILNFVPDPLDDIKNTIFVPSVSINSGGKPRLYGTRTQTLILLDVSGHVKYIERTVHADDGEASDRVIQTALQNW